MIHAIGAYINHKNVNHALEISNEIQSKIYIGLISGASFAAVTNLPMQAVIKTCMIWQMMDAAFCQILKGLTEIVFKDDKEIVQICYHGISLIFISQTLPLTLLALDVNLLCNHRTQFLASYCIAIPLFARKIQTMRNLYYTYKLKEDAAGGKGF